MSRPDFLPFAKPSIGEEEIEEVIQALRSGWLTSGPRVRRFEEGFAGYLGVAHAVAVNSATAALHLALEALGVGEGDRILTSTYTFTATAEVATYLGADPVFVDVEKDSLNLDPDMLETKLRTTPGVKAVIPVHFAGRACDMGSILELCRAHGAKVVDDAAHALPASHRGRRVGTLADVTAFSFYVTKTLATGEGGMLVTDSEEVASRARVMRLHGIDRDVFDRYVSEKPSWWYEVVAPGFKYNMTDIAAAIGLWQLTRVEEFRDRREAIAHRYDEAFSDLPLELPPAGANTEDVHAWHLYVVRLCLDRLQIDRDEFIRQMSGEGIGTSVHFIPLHIQPYWRDRYGLVAEDFPVAMEAFRRVVSLPIYPSMTNEDVERVIGAVQRILMRNGA